MTWRLTYPKLSSAEAEIATGASQSFQRDLRRRGFMAEREGTRARYGTLQLAELFVIARLSQGGIGPSFSTKMNMPRSEPAASVATQIVLHASTMEAAISDPHNLRGGEPILEFLPDSLSRYVVWDGDGQWHWVDVVEHGLVYSDSEWSVVIDLQRAARILVQRSPKPLFRIEAVSEVD